MLTFLLLSCAFPWKRQIIPGGGGGVFWWGGKLPALVEIGAFWQSSPEAVVPFVGLNKYAFFTAKFWSKYVDQNFRRLHF